MPEAVRKQLADELDLVDFKGYAPYFLTVEAIVRYARSQGILCQGRGSAANSAICYCLGITAIDPVAQGLLFARFINVTRDEPPDIDVDFEHERREEVIQWIYATYGRARAALTATVIRYGARGAVREVGKVLGVPDDVTGALARLVWGWSRDGVGEREAKALGLDLSQRALRLTLEIARALIGTPRHFGQHPGGFVLTLDRLDDLCPVVPARMENRQIIEWDKDDIETLRFMKVDVLGLGMLGCLRRAFTLLAEHRPETNPPREIADIPPDDEPTYAMIQKADTIGVFQIESRAQMAMLPRMQPKNLYDLTIEVAIVRPGPIQGDMVHPYLRRRRGIDPVTYPTRELESVLERTLGVPLFQEQAMQVAIVAAGFTPAEADGLRRAMGTFKGDGTINLYEEKLVGGMIANGYDPDFAARTYRQLEGFGSYGFPESHAASFALVAYASSWLKCRHPDVFACALLNAQPMGFYAPAQIVRDARAHDVEVRPIDVNASRWDCTLEPAGEGRLAVRLGLRLVRGLPNQDGARLATVREADLFRSVEDLWRRAGLSLKACGAWPRRTPSRASASIAAPPCGRSAGSRPSRCRSSRRPTGARPRPPRTRRAAGALDALGGRGRRGGGLPGVGLEPRPPPARLPAGGSRARRRLGLRGAPPAARRRPGDGGRAGAGAPEAGLGQGRDVHHPGGRDRHRQPGDLAVPVHPPAHPDPPTGLMAARGRVQREGEVIHLVAEHLIDRSDLLARVARTRGRALAVDGGRGDEARRGGGDARGAARPLRVGSRDFR